MQTYMIECGKPSGWNRIGFPDQSDFRGVVMAEYMLVHGIRVAKSFVSETFGRLTTLGPDFYMPSNIVSRLCVVCQCSCGEHVVARRRKLKRGEKLSCGCLQREAAGRSNLKHGMRKSPEYSSWSEMRKRCGNVNHIGFSDYGGRGIKVCERWHGERGFQNFLEDLGCKPSSKHSIDRIDNEGNYCPENCRWATPKEQANNRRPRTAWRPL